MLRKMEGKRKEGSTEDESCFSGITGSMSNKFEQTPGRWWMTEEPGVLQCKGWQRVTHDLVNEEQLQNLPKRQKETTKNNEAPLIKNI